MFHNIGLHIKVKNFEKSKKFYKSLGFHPVFEYGPNKKVKEDYSGIVFEHGTTKIEIADGHRAVKTDVFKQTILSSKTSLMISVDSLKSVINRCKRHSIKITVGPRHYYWGTLELVIKDPDGMVLVFIAPFTHLEATRLKSDETFAKSPIAKRIVRRLR